MTHLIFQNLYSQYNYTTKQKECLLLQISQNETQSDQFFKFSTIFKLHQTTKKILCFFFYIVSLSLEHKNKKIFFTIIISINQSIKRFLRVIILLRLLLKVSAEDRRNDSAFSDSQPLIFQRKTPAQIRSSRLCPSKFQQ